MDDAAHAQAMIFRIAAGTAFDDDVIARFERDARDAQDGERENGTFHRILQRHKMNAEPAGIVYASRTWRPAVKGIVEQCPDAGVVDRSGIEIRILGGERSRAVETVFRHADLPQRARRSEAGREIEQPLRRIADAERARHTLHGRSRRVGVEGGRMRQDDRVDFSVRQVERPAERMTQLVMQAHAGRAERGAAEPRSVQGLGPCIKIVR